MNAILLAVVLWNVAAPAAETSDTPTTRLYVRTAPPGATVSLDGKPLGKSDGLFVVPPGVARLEIVLDGRRSEVRRVEVSEGRITRVVVELKPEQRRPAIAAGARHGYLGLVLVPLTAVTVNKSPALPADIAAKVGVAAGEGVFVAGFIQDAPAAVAGVKAGDVIVEFAGKRVDNPQQLQSFVSQFPAGEVEPLVVIRDRKRMTLKVTLREQPPGYGALPMTTQEWSPRSGLELEPLTADIAAKVGVAAGEGVVVAGLIQDAPAAAAGVKAGDVIVEFAGKPVGNPQQLQSLVDQFPAGAVEPLVVIRDRKRMTLKLTLRGQPPGYGVFPTTTEEFSLRLGLALQALTADVAANVGVAAGEGVFVRGWCKDSPAIAAGAKAGDIIVEFAGKPVGNVQQLQSLVGQFRAGAVEPLVVIRDRKRMTLNVTLGEQPPGYGVLPMTTREFSLNTPYELNLGPVLPMTTRELSQRYGVPPTPGASAGSPRAPAPAEAEGQSGNPPAPAAAAETAKPAGAAAWDVLGVKLKPIPPNEFRKEHPASHYRGGLLVQSVRPDSPADVQGVVPGDVLVGIHIWETLTPENVEYIVKRGGSQNVGLVKFFILRAQSADRPNDETLYGYLLFATKTAKQGAGLSSLPEAPKAPLYGQPEPSVPTAGGPAPATPGEGPGPVPAAEPPGSATANAPGPGSTAPPGAENPGGLPGSWPGSVPAGPVVVNLELASPTPGGPAAAIPSAKKGTVETALSREFSLGKGSDLSLSELCQQVRDWGRINVAIDQRALQDARLSPSLKLRREAWTPPIPLDSALDLLLDAVGLCYTVHDDVLRITTPKQAQGDLWTRQYFLSKLAANRELVGAITNTIDSASWHARGALSLPPISPPSPNPQPPAAGEYEPGSCRFNSVAGQGWLVIRQTYSVHRQIAAFLNELQLLASRRGAKGPLPPLPVALGHDGYWRDTPQTEAIRNALEKPVSLDIVDVPLSHLAEHLKPKPPINVVLDRRPLKAAGISEDTTLTVRLKDVPLGQLLTAVFEDVNLAYTVTDDVLLITTPDEARHVTTTALYPVGDLVARGQKTQDLVEAIRLTIHEGPGWGATATQVLGLSGAVDALAICKTAEGHRQIGELLRQLRRQPRGKP